MKKRMLVFLLLVVALSGVLPLEARDRSRRARSDDRARAEVRGSASRHRVERRARPRRIVVIRPVVRTRSYRSRDYYYISRYTGIKFHMGLIPKDQHELVKRGIVTIDGAEQGIVDRYDSWQNGHVSVAAGEHAVTVELEDGRVFQTEVLVQPGQTIHIYLRF